MTEQVSKFNFEQGSFIKECWTGSSSIVLEAVAGSGKTTVLMESLKKIKGQTAVIAFNKTIATELKNRILKMGIEWKKAEAGTVHSFGLRAYKKIVPNVVIDGDKLFNLIGDYFDLQKEEANELPSEMKGMVRKLVSLAKNNGVGVQCKIDHDEIWMDMIEHFDVNDSDEIEDRAIIETSKVILRLSNKMKETIDFDDMIYLPLLMGARFWQYDNVMIDEAQDINWSRRAMARAMLKPNGRLIAVGDRKQAIYGFTGADSESLDNIRKEFNAIEMPLTTCYRCGTDIIAMANRWNDKIRAHDGASKGEVSTMFLSEFLDKTDLNSDSVMLCRNTKPLVETAFDFIRRGIAVYVEGRDIGEGLKKLASRWRVKNIDSLITRLENYRQTEVQKALVKGKESKAAMIEDQVETLMVIINRCINLNKNRVSDVIFEIDNIFKDTQEGKSSVFTLSTIHKSKGREWKTVYWLDRAGTLPSKYARQSWQIEQENNLCYVASTRAMDRLIEVIKDS